MPTFTQALLLGTERIATPPAPPHPALGEAWSRLDWAGAKEAALLDAAALVGTARGAGAVATGALPAPEPAPDEARPLASPRAVAVLRQLFAEEWRVLLPEWMERCAQRGAVVPPFFLRTLFHLADDPVDRERVRRIAGERGRWLAAQNPEWAWLHAGDAAAPLDSGIWETGTAEERLGWFARARQSAPDEARQRLEQTWAEEPPDFRAQAVEAMRAGLGAADEVFLTRVLKDRRKEVRTGAQALLSTLPQAGLASRMRDRAEAMLTCQRGFLGRKLEVNLPAAFDSGWTADGIEEKPPAGLGEKAFWTQQILALVPLRHWAEKFDLDPSKLIDLAAKSGDWGDLLFGAWYRSACLHRDAGAAAALIRPVLARQKPPVPGVPGVPGVPALAAATNLLAQCDEAQRWEIVAELPDLAWAALPLLDGSPTPAQGRALFDHLARALRDGFNPGGSPAAVLAARRLPPGLRAEAARQLARDNGLSKPAEAFLQALELRATLHEAFA